MDFVDLSQVAIPEEIIRLVPRHVAERFKVIPIAVSDSGIMIAVSDPEDFDTMDCVTSALQHHAGELEWVCSTPEQIQFYLCKHYDRANAI